QGLALRSIGRRRVWSTRNHRRQCSCSTPLQCACLRCLVVVVVPGFLSIHRCRLFIVVACCSLTSHHRSFYADCASFASLCFFGWFRHDETNTFINGKGMVM